MNPETRRTLLALVICLGILFGWSMLLQTMYPPPPRPAAEPEAAAPAGTTQPEAVAIGAPEAAPGAVAPEPPAPTAGRIVAAEAVDAGPIELGRDAPRGGEPPNPFYVALRLTPRGAAVMTADLTDERNVVPDRRNPQPDTYDLMSPVPDPARETPHAALATQRLRLVEQQVDVDLESVTWAAERTADESGETARFSTTIERDGSAMLRLTKVYRLARDSRMVRLELTVENVSGAAQSIILKQGGPGGFRREELRIDDRHAYAFYKDDVARPHTRSEAWKSEGRRLPLHNDEQKLGWAGVGNKYFCCLMAPLPAGTSVRVDYVRLAEVYALTDSPDAEAGDVSVAWVLAPETPLGPGGSFSCAFDVYFGPRSPRLMNREPAAAAHRFELIYAADRSACTFEWLSQVMIRLFALLHRVLPGEHNYGWAIIVLVLIVRTILHPLTKRSQVNMTKMQKGMAALQPKLEAIKQKYANDKQKMNETVMELYRSEGVNPAGSMLGCMPLFLQMPIWIALWSTLNTSVELRHEPFLLWIRDLAAPDALYALGTTIHIPLLGAITGPITAVNVLPVVMGVTMYLQQKYTQRLTRPTTPPPASPSASGRPSGADQLAMQQKMMSFMTIFFALMFYNFPSGLNLYILTSNLFGMLEQSRIRKHIRDEEARAASAPAGDKQAGSRMPGWLARLQKKAEEARQVRTRADRRR